MYAMSQRSGAPKQTTRGQPNYTCVLYLRRSPKTKDKFNLQLLTWMNESVYHMVRAGIVIDIKIVSDEDTKLLATKGITMTPALVPHPHLLPQGHDKIIFGIDAIADFIEYHCTPKSQPSEKQPSDSADNTVHDILMDAINSEDVAGEDDVDMDRVRQEMSKRVSQINTTPVTRNSAAVVDLVHKQNNSTRFGDSIENTDDVLARRTSSKTGMVDIAGEAGMDDAVLKFWENQEVTPM